MTKQDLNNIALTDEELEAAAGGAGQWVAPTRGQWWVWQVNQSSASGNPAALSASAEQKNGTTRCEVSDGKSHYYKFDGSKEVLVGIR